MKITTKLLSTLALALLLGACTSQTQSKVETSKTTIQNEANLKLQEEEAKKCQLLKTKDEKLTCYENMKDTNTFAMLRLAIYNLKVTKDYKTANELFEKMIDKGNYHGYLGLAGSYFGGYGVKKDEKKTLELLEKSYKKDPMATFRLGVFYQNGIGVEKDEKKAFELLQSAGEKGLLQAQVLLSKIYHIGTNLISKNEEKAKYWDDKIKANDNSLMSIYKF